MEGTNTKRLLMVECGIRGVGSYGSINRHTGISEPVVIPAPSMNRCERLIKESIRLTQVYYSTCFLTVRLQESTYMTGNLLSMNSPYTVW